MDMSHLEVLFVSHKYPPSVGGMEKQSYELINGVSALTNIHKIVYSKDESIIRFFRKLNKRILKVLRENPKISIIHFNDGLIAAFSMSHKGYDHLKKVVTIHGLDIVFPWRYYQKTIIPRFNSFHHIIAVSQATADAAIKAGIDANKISIIENAVDHNILNLYTIPKEQLCLKYPQIDPNKKYFITLGRPVKRKGFSWLMKEVLPKIKDDFQVIMVGPFDRKAKITERILQLLPKKVKHLISLFLGHPTDQKEIRKLLKQENSKVIHLGKVPFQDLKYLLSNANAFLMPNIKVQGDMEGFGLVCLEASIAGCLVVAAKIEGITSAIKNGENGILLASEDSSEWINQLKDILNNETGYQEKAEQYKKYTLENFSWKKMSEEYFKLFQSL